MITKTKTNQLKVKSTYKTSPNIAFIKYWGKIDDENILPLNSSLGVTLDYNDLCTNTKVQFSDQYEQDELLLNGKSEKISQRLQRIFIFFREKHIKNLETKELEGIPLNKLCELKNFQFQIKSENSFPTASGLASSASGLAALALCICDIFDFKEEYENQMSEIARLGSGSASRSIYGGVVQWDGPKPEYLERFYQNGFQLLPEEVKELSQTCITHQIIDESALQNLEILILVAGFDRKQVPSTDGMKNSVLNSELLRERALKYAPLHLQQILEAFHKNDFNQVAELTIKDSNQFHSVCLDTTPPIFYLNEFSQLVIQVIHQFNILYPKCKVGYTFDAGPHAVLFIQKEIFPSFFNIIMAIFNIKEEQLNERGRFFNKENQKTILDQGAMAFVKDFQDSKASDQLHSLIYTKPGKDPLRNHGQY